MIKLKWSRPLKDKARLIDFSKQGILHVDNSNPFFSIDPENGESLWHHKFKSKHQPNQSPIVIDDIVIVLWEKYLSAHELNSGKLLWELECSKGKACEFPDYLKSDELDFYCFLFQFKQFIYVSSYAGIIRKIDIMSGEFEIMNSTQSYSVWLSIGNNELFLSEMPIYKMGFYKLLDSKLEQISNFEREEQGSFASVQSESFFFLQFKRTISVFDSRNQKLLYDIRIDSELLNNVYEFENRIIIVTNREFFCLDNNFNKLWNYRFDDLNSTCSFSTGMMFHDSYKGLNYLSFETGEIVKVDLEPQVVYDLHSYDNDLLIVSDETLKLFKVDL